MLKIPTFLILILSAILAVQGFFQGHKVPSRIMASQRTSSGLSASESDAAPTMKKFCLNVNLYVKPERREEFLKTIAINAAGTLSNEPLNISYTWGESTTEKNTFHFQEQFKGEEGFQAHTNSPHFAIWKEFADAEDSPFWKPPVVFFFETLWLRSSLSRGDTELAARNFSIWCKNKREITHSQYYLRCAILNLRSMVWLFLLVSIHTNAL